MMPLARMACMRGVSAVSLMVELSLAWGEYSTGKRHHPAPAGLPSGPMSHGPRNPRCCRVGKELSAEIGTLGNAFMERVWENAGWIESSLLAAQLTDSQELRIAKHKP